MRILVLDNYDSFTYNLVQYLGELATPAHDIEVVRNDHASVDELLVRGLRPGDRLARAVHAQRGRDQPRGRPALPGRRDPDARRLPRPPGAGPGVGRQGRSATSRCTARRRRSSTTAGRSSAACRSRSRSAATTRWSSTPSCPTCSRQRRRRRRRDGGPPPRAARRGRPVPPRVGPHRAAARAARELPRATRR